MKPGHLVTLPGGREGTVVYHGLDGYGIIWGRRVLHERDINALNKGTADLYRIGVSPIEVPESLEPEAMLCMKCRWTGAADTPFSGSDPGCAVCDGEGYRDV